MEELQGNPFASINQIVRGIEELNPGRTTRKSGIGTRLSEIWTRQFGSFDERMVLTHQQLSKRNIENSLSLLDRKLYDFTTELEDHIRAAAIEETLIPALQGLSQNSEENIRVLLNEIDALNLSRINWAGTRENLMKMRNALKGTVVESSAKSLDRRIKELDSLIISIPIRDKQFWVNQLKNKPVVEQEP